MMKKLIVFVVLMMSLLLIPSAHAVAIGASPATLSFDVPQGGSVEKTVKISTNAGNYVDFTLKKSDGIANFTTLSPENGKTKSGEQSTITVKVLVPKNTKLGTYSGVISVKTTGSGTVNGGSGSVISTGVTVAMSINVIRPPSVGLGTPLLVTLAMAAIITFGAVWFMSRKRKPQQ